MGPPHTPAPTATPHPRARIITQATDTTLAGESFDERFARQVAERNAAPGKVNVAQPTPPTPSDNETRLTDLLNNATGPLSGPGPRFTTKGRLAEMDEEHMVVIMGDSRPITVWKADLPPSSTPQPNAPTGARLVEPNA